MSEPGDTSTSEQDDTVTLAPGAWDTADSEPDRSEPDDADGSEPGRWDEPARWRLPLDERSRVLRRFAPPPRPWLPGHRGVDLAATPGGRVRAAGAGIVGYAGPLAGRGVVMIVHGGLRTTYLPVRPKVRRGQTVTRGQVIGTVERTAGHCPISCLHWGLIGRKGYLDPLLLVALGQVRLLPHWPTPPP
ncbi:hypothetical protein Sme01_70500 [Sphaerisporangium melleum]|uniref:M23ase beta-sheet core domain-containing protein n=1 Tax=Sphaerisporangium melleum TaxID=321316 RepID=A0A917VUE6_9ACTN|nr:hypothetical protein GCM10007964_66960 [Sphaerisporangium melleum]GII74574.1 hypothetical protein Sme01_70500 [Sphaerisporangium melleum]